MNNDLWLEVKYVNLISNKVQKFKRLGDQKWRFRCPICGDSTKDKNKARGYVFPYKGRLIFHCHNCGASKNVPSLIESIDSFLYKEFLLEKFGGKKQEPDIKIESNVKQTFENRSILKGTRPIDSLDDNHPAKKYVIKRKIPEKHFGILYYCPKFAKWVNSIIPKKLPEIGKDEPRLVIPFFDKDGNIFGFQGRSFDKNATIRYITIMFDDNQTKIYGLERIDLKKTVKIVEGPIDSLFLDNCLASADGSLYSNLDIVGSEDVVLIFDNEPRNKDTVKKMDRAINRGLSLVIWPNDIIEKDINDMVLNNIPVDRIINNNIYNGLEARLKLSEWKRT